MRNNTSASRTSNRLSGWNLFGLFGVGVVIASVPFWVAIEFPRGLDRFLFSVGASFCAAAILAVIFPELRTPPNPRFAFQSNVRLVLCTVLLTCVFFGIVALGFYFRAQGWWR